MHTQKTCQRVPLKLALAAALALASLAIPVGAAPVSADATATATVIIPITITKTADLSFGKFAPGVGGSVTVSTSGGRSATGAILSTIGSTPTAARFTVHGETSATYAITYTGSANLTSGSDTMVLTKISDLTGLGATSGTQATGALDGTTGDQSIYVGGSLAVGAAQPSGTYTGTVTVAVEYN
jgi:spore coat protein U-like protein